MIARTPGSSHADLLRAPPKHPPSHGADAQKAIKSNSLCPAAINYRLQGLEMCVIERPSWVKRDQGRFPRAKLPDGRSLDILSAFAPATRAADSRAFVALLEHIRAIDAAKNTVLMIQVENEIGMLPVARDYSPDANRLFHQKVPEELVRRLATKRAGDWESLFGPGDAAGEAFMAWHYARYVESLVSAGKAVYPLPMYVNTALNRPNKAPGEYPSGGPLPHLFAIWKAGAPSLDLLAPDIYFPDFIERARGYERPDNPLFIPEANNADKPEVPANAFYAFGKLDALGFGPFSIESVDERQPNPLAQAYAVLEQLAPMILASQGLERMSGFRPEVLGDGTVSETPVTQTIGDYRFTVTFIDPWMPRAEQQVATHGGLIIQTGPEDYLVAGQGITVTVEPAASEDAPSVGLDSVWEGSFDARGTWIPGRLLNGDQTHQGRHLRLAPGQYQIQRVRLYRYR
jgi:beta-galactosidase GanA